MASRTKVKEAPIGAVFTVGIDGGKPPKTCFASNAQVTASERPNPHPLWRVDRKPPASLFTLAIAERPGAIIWAGRNGDSLISPAGWSMAALFSVQLAPDGMRVWIPTEQWKRKLLGSTWNMKKKSACRNFVEMFSLKGLDPENDADQDEIDAVAIAEAGQRFTRRELKKWQVKW